MTVSVIAAAVLANTVTEPVFDATGLSLGLAIFRIAVGGIMLAHGINHIFGGGKIRGTAGWFASLGMKPGIFHAWMASLAEIGGGILLILGLFTPLGAAAVCGTMIVAFITNHRKNGFFIFRPGEGWEYVGLLICSGLAIAAAGPGTWSIDQLLGFDWVSGSVGFAIAVIAGLGGGLMLLLGFWRPDKKNA
jgi:putative oxidoreductase